VFLPDYNVSVSEVVVAAGNVSEQISPAGTGPSATTAAISGMPSPCPCPGAQASGPRAPDRRREAEADLSHQGDLHTGQVEATSDTRCRPAREPLARLFHCRSRQEARYRFAVHNPVDCLCKTAASLCGNGGKVGVLAPARANNGPVTWDSSIHICA
jgi:hypothetical protein